MSEALEWRHISTAPRGRVVWIAFPSWGDPSRGVDCGLAISPVPPETEGAADWKWLNPDNGFQFHAPYAWREVASPPLPPPFSDFAHTPKEQTT